MKKRRNPFRGNYIIMKTKMKRMINNEWFCFGGAMVVSWSVMIVLLLLLSAIAYWGALSEGIAAVAILVIYFAGNVSGGFLAGMSVLGKHYLAGMILGFADFMLLLILSLAVNHTLRDFGGVFFTTLAIFVGSGALGGMIAGLKKKKL